MNYLHRALLITLIASFAVGSVNAQKKSRNKKAATKKTSVSPKKSPAAIQTEEVNLSNRKDNTSDTASPKVVTITSAFKPYLRYAAKVNFTAASPVIDSSKMDVVYTIPSQNLFFTYQPIPLKPLALPIDSGYIWENKQYIKLGAGNASSYLAEVALSFGDGKNTITNLRGNFLSATGSLPAQQSTKWGIDLLSIFNTRNNDEWTTHPYYQSSTQYFYGYEPSTLPYQKDQLLQQFSTIGLEAGMQNKTANSMGIKYHPQIMVTRFIDNREANENNFVLKAPINKAFGKIYALDVGINTDLSTANFPLIPNPLILKNNLYSINTSLQFKTPNFKLNAGLLPSWDNENFSLFPNLFAEAKVADINLVLEAGWVGNFQKNSYRSLASFNPWINTLTNGLLNTKISEQYAGMKAASGDHLTYQLKVSLLQLNNQPLFLNDTNDGKTFRVIFEPEMQAFRVHAELSYAEKESIAVSAGVTYSQYSALQVNSKAWGLLPLEATGSLKWKLLKDLQVKADLFLWDGSPYQDKTLQTKKGNAVADLNLGAEFTVIPKLNLWLQMNNLLNTSYQRWNQYSVLGFTILGGVVYSFR